MLVFDRRYHGEEILKTGYYNTALVSYSLCYRGFYIAQRKLLRLNSYIPRCVLSRLCPMPLCVYLSMHIHVCQLSSDRSDEPTSPTICYCYHPLAWAASNALFCTTHLLINPLLSTGINPCQNSLSGNGFRTVRKSTKFSLYRSSSISITTEYRDWPSYGRGEPPSHSDPAYVEYLSLQFSSSSRSDSLSSSSSSSYAETHWSSSLEFSGAQALANVASDSLSEDFEDS